MKGKKCAGSCAVRVDWTELGSGSTPNSRTPRRPPTGPQALRRCRHELSINGGAPVAPGAAYCQYVDSSEPRVTSVVSSLGLPVASL